MRNLKLILFLLLFSVSVNPAFALDEKAVTSGRLIAQNIKTIETAIDDRPMKLKAYLEAKNSPCSDYADEFVKFADMYGLDWKLGPAIAGIESSFCQIYPLENNNPFGIAGGNYHFISLSDSIKYLNKLIATNGYYTLFQQTRDLSDLAIVYCELPKKWANAVSRFMIEIDNFDPDNAPDVTNLKINL